MIIEIPNENSIVKWKNDDKDEWKVAEVSDLIKAYEVDIETQLLGAKLHGMKIGYEEAQKKLLRPTGEWVIDNWGIYHCNYCMKEKQQLFNNFCGNCGASMGGKKNE